MITTIMTMTIMSMAQMRTATVMLMAIAMRPKTSDLRSRWAPR
jgi:hypothetical protein